MTAKEFEQGIKTGLNKLSEQDIKQIRDEFNSEPDYPIPSQIPKKIVFSKMTGGGKIFISKIVFSVKEKT